MPGLIFVSPGSFESPGGLPTVPVRRVSPIRGASIDWAADRLPDGPVSSWTDQLGGYTLQAPASTAQWPTASNGALIFDGTSGGDRIDTALPTGKPKTIVLVAQVNAVPNARIFSGGTASMPQFDFGINSDGSRFTFYCGSGMSANNYGAADSDWHVFIIVADSANSSISVDGVENTGNSGTNPAANIRLGASATAYYKSQVKRLAILPYAATAAERATINTQLSQHYNI